MTKPDPDHGDEREGPLDDDNAADADRAEPDADSKDSADDPAAPDGEPSDEAADTSESDSSQAEPADEEAARPPFVTMFMGYLSTANTVMVTLYSFVLAMLIGGVLVIVSDDSVRRTFGYFFDRPLDALSASWNAVSEVYVGLFTGSILDVNAVQAWMAGTGDLRGVLSPISETTTYAAPLILAGLAVGLAFRAGLFNIGAQGQVIMGTIGAAIVGFAFQLPLYIHLPMALLGGIIAGALFGAVPGVLKATTGAHEVISSIMLNYVALFGLLWVVDLSWVSDPDKTHEISKPVESSAMLPKLFSEVSPLLRANAGILLAIAVALGVAWLLSKSTFGYRMRSVGLNPHASRAAGMSVPRTYAESMATAGGLAGLAGAVVVLSVPPHALTSGVAGEIGFDGITVALLGRAKPMGIVAAGLLFGALRAGAVSTQAVPLDMVTILQALIVMFIAAPALVKSIMRLRTPVGGLAATTAKGW